VSSDGQGFNAPIFGAKYVDFHRAIHPNEASVTLISTIGTDPANFVHLNDAGYAAASRGSSAAARQSQRRVSRPQRNEIAGKTLRRRFSLLLSSSNSR